MKYRIHILIEAIGMEDDFSEIRHQVMANMPYEQVKNKADTFLEQFDTDPEWGPDWER